MVWIEFVGLGGGERVVKMLLLLLPLFCSVFPLFLLCFSLFSGFSS